MGRGCFTEVCDELTCCGYAGLLWRASLLALGCEAALNRLMRCIRHSTVPGFGAASQPSASKLARHSERAHRSAGL